MVVDIVTLDFEILMSTMLSEIELCCDSKVLTIMLAKMQVNAHLLVLTCLCLMESETLQVLYLWVTYLIFFSTESEGA